MHDLTSSFLEPLVIRLLQLPNPPFLACHSKKKTRESHENSEVELMPSRQIAHRISCWQVLASVHMINGTLVVSKAVDRFREDAEEMWDGA
jgi:hypothetical protein